MNLRLALRLVLIAALAGGPAAALAEAGPNATDQSTPGLADTPGEPSEVGHTKPVTEMEVQLQEGRALLDSAVLLKTYYYAYAGGPVDYSAILTPNTENIEPPAPAKPTDAEKAAIDKLIGEAKAHPELMIDVGDIALDAYDEASSAYPLDNRLFIANVGYYFDNSPYHYVYANPAGFRLLRCTDAATRTTLNEAIANYVHFRMRIAAHITGVDKDAHALTLTLDDIEFRTNKGETLLTQNAD